MISLRLGLGISDVQAPSSSWTPASLPLAGYWFADGSTGYVGGSTGTFLGQASAGASSGRNLTQATAGQVPGTTSVNGHNAPNFDGANDLLASALTSDSFVANARYYGWVLFVTDSVSRDDAESSAYNNDPLIRVDGSWFGVTVRSTGPKCQVWQFDGAWKAAEVAYTGGSLQLLQFKYDGTTVSARINGGAWVTRTVGNIENNGVLSIGGASFVPTYLDGRIVSVGLSDQAAPADSVFDQLRTYLGSRYGASL